MATSQYIIGNDGAVTIGAETNDQMKVKSFAVTLSRNSSDLTAFGDTGKRKKLGLLDCTGSLNGIPLLGSGTAITASNSTTGQSLLFYKTTYGASITATSSVNTAVLTLKLFDDGTAKAQIVSNVVFSSFAFNSDKSGDASVTASFENGDGNAPVLTWSI
jgi:hypothetical protein